ncbi:hypothetical protein BGZ65_001367 [Modicella reniformis]|uniref:ABC transporter domain-containing protein n=1 Tax=Modicella reniformis TaxID=1440133 RepID=A0A9P6J1V9_9FUNG|nr:hypothetical protein BGZ65_001367 [Modicella reniformis]
MDNTHSPESAPVKAAGIELTLQSLSLSITRPPSFVTRLARKLRLTPSSHPPPPPPPPPLHEIAINNADNEDKDAPQPPEITARRTDHDLRNVGTSIFRNVDLTVKPGQGGSGCGKTTLLNMIAGRMKDPGVVTSGSIRCNGEKPKKYWNDGSVGYLQQNDFLMPFLSVRETLHYAAHLRLPRTMSSEKKRELVELVLLELGLKDCADTRVGDPGGGESGGGGIRGISGGERRRVSAAVQLLTNPKMLLCDEVTSGLDAFSSYEVMKSLTHLAKSSQKTIVISIHQPRSEIFKLLLESDGQIVLLSKGDVIYSGPIRSVLSWIESTGVDACPPAVNPFDYLLDLSMVDYTNDNAEKGTAQRRDLLVKAWAQREGDLWLALSALSKEDELTTSSLAVEIIPQGTARPSLLSQILVLTSRGWINQIRDKLLVWSCLVESIVLGLVVGAIFYQMDDSLDGIFSHSGLIYGAGSIQPYLMLMVTIFRLSREMVIFDLFSAIVYYLTGLRTDSAHHFVWWILVNVAMQFVVGFSAASLLANGIYMLFVLSTGFLIITRSIPPWLRWIQNIAYPSAFYRILTSNEFTDHRFACPYVGEDGSWDHVKCSLWDGNSILKNQLDVEPHYYPGPIVRFVYYYFGFHLVAWLALTVKEFNPTYTTSGPTLMDVALNRVAMIFSRKRATAVAESTLVTSATAFGNDSIKVEEIRLDMFAKGLERRDPVTIRVEGLCLSVSMPTKWKFSSMLKNFGRIWNEKELLKDVDAVFPAGELTAILGGSGAGKTSLLNVLLHRTSSNLKKAGSIYYNDTKNPSLRTINGISSYVRQDDNFLLSHLTVRETLRYAAELRMDSSISKSDKYAKVEDIIDLLGLRECANVLIGNSVVRGCSGGQRRRVSIGIQLVTEPACLFLDEPTSGLDALTAKKIILTLKKIAATGRTIVCTIHQPRADIWHVFDNVVLLVTGGRVAYTGRTDNVVEYFQEAGYVAPPFTNVADFILDTASVNLRSIDLERSTRKAVDTLIQRFQDNKRTMLASQLPNHPLGELTKVKNIQFTPFSKACSVLAHRSFVNIFRQKILYFNRILQPVIAAIMANVFFLSLPSGSSDIKSRIGMLQQTITPVYASIVINFSLYFMDRDIAYREISDGGYSATSFFASFLMNELPLEIVSSFGVTVITLEMTHMKNTVFTFFSFWLVIFGYTNAGESISIVFSTLSTHSGFGFTAATAVTSIFGFMTGFLSHSIPTWLNYINHASLLKYGSVILAKNEFEGKVFDCSADPSLINSRECPFPTGEAILELLKFNDKNWNLYMALFLTVVVIYRLLAWMILVAKVKGNRW